MSPTSQEINRQRHWVCALQVAERRRGLGLTQRDVVARLDQLGVPTSNRTLSAMEHGQGLDVGRLPELAIALECTVTYLLGLTTDPTSWEPEPNALPGLGAGSPAAVTAALPGRMPGMAPHHGNGLTAAGSRPARAGSERA